jgi:hypothetical protein
MPENFPGIISFFRPYREWSGGPKSTATASNVTLQHVYLCILHYIHCMFITESRRKDKKYTAHFDNGIATSFGGRGYQDFITYY